MAVFSAIVKINRLPITGPYSDWGPKHLALMEWSWLKENWSFVWHKSMPLWEIFLMTLTYIPAQAQLTAHYSTGLTSPPPASLAEMPTASRHAVAKNSDSRWSRIWPLPPWIWSCWTLALAAIRAWWDHLTIFPPPTESETVLVWCSPFHNTSYQSHFFFLALKRAQHTWLCTCALISTLIEDAPIWEKAAVNKYILIMIYTTW